MRDFVRRLERLEDRTAPGNGPILVSWIGDPVAARYGETVLDRHAGEGLKEFTKRVVEAFPTAPYIWLASGRTR